MPLLIEDATCPEIEASGIAQIERLSDGRICVVLYVERHGPDGMVFQQVAGRIIGAAASLPAGMRSLARAMGENDVVVVAEAGQILPVN